MTDNATLSVNDVTLLRHCVGYTAGLKLRGATYNAYRNYYCSGGVSPAFERLCKLGVCVHGERRQNPRSADYVYYHITPAGAKLLGDYLGVQIVLPD